MLRLIFVAVLLVGCAREGVSSLQDDSASGDREASAEAVAGEQYYRVTLAFSWSPTSHGAESFPVRQPGQSIGWEPHFTNFSTVTHNANYSMFEVGELASRNLEGTAEQARSDYFRREWVENRSALGTNAYGGCIAEQQRFFPTYFANNCLFVQGIPTPAVTSFVIKVEREKPLLSMASMLAPSADWFVGLSGYSLFVDGQWQEEHSLPLLAMEAGTETGLFTYQNPAEQPAQPISVIEGFPFFGIPVGEVTLTPLGSNADIDLQVAEPMFDGFTTGRIPVPSRLGE